MTLVGGVGAGLLLAMVGCATAGVSTRSSPASSEPIVGGSFDRPAQYMVSGSVTQVDLQTRSLTIQTPMKLQERIRFDEGTEINRPGLIQSWAVMRPGTPVKIDYEIEGDGSVLAKRISVGQSVRYCPCGPDCRCPPSRGCRVIRVPGAQSGR